MNGFTFGSEAEGWEKYTSTEYSVLGSRQTGVCRSAILFSRNKAQLQAGVGTRQVYGMLWALPPFCACILVPAVPSKPCSCRKHTQPRCLQALESCMTSAWTIHQTQFKLGEIKLKMTGFTTSSKGVCNSLFVFVFSCPCLIKTLVTSSWLPSVLYIGPSWKAGLKIG